LRIHERQPIHMGRVGRPLGCTGCLGSLMAPLLGLPIVVLTLGGISMSQKGSDAAALAAYEACPAITAALGTPLEEATLSMGCGESSSGGGHGDAEWTITIVGPKGRASGWYHASYHGGGPWTVLSATATLPDGQTVSAVPCPSPAPPAPAPEPPARGGGKGGKGGKRR
jgi:hypothetical protein